MIQFWNYIRFGDLFNYKNKSKIKAGDGLTSGSFPFYTSSVELIKFIDEFQFDRTSLIFGTGGNASIHYCDKQFSVSTDCLVAIANDENKVYPKYVFYYLSGNINLLEEGFKGAGLKHVSKGYINDIQIPLPPLDTQKRIAEILDAADALRRKDKELLKKYDELAQAIFIDMFGDPQENELNFERTQIGKVVTFIGGSQPPKNKFTYKAGDGLVRLIQIRDYKSDRFATYIPKTSTKKFCNESDIMIGRYGPPVFQILRGIEGAYNVALMKALPSSVIDSEYLFYLLSSNYIQDIVIANSKRTAGQTGVNLKILEKIEISIPHIDLQLKFKDRVELIKRSKFNAQNIQFQSSELFESLLQKAFKGELVA